MNKRAEIEVINRVKIELNLIIGSKVKRVEIVVVDVGVENVDMDDVMSMDVEIEVPYSEIMKKDSKLKQNWYYM